MCAPTSFRHDNSRFCPSKDNEKAPIERLLDPPSALARATCVSILIGIFSIWCKFAFIDERDIPGGRQSIHSGWVPLGMTVFYLVSLPLLRMFTNHFLQTVDVKVMLRESMILYNAAQVLLNGWMVYRIVDAILFRGHSFIGGPINQIDTGASFAVYVHYCDKYLEYMDTYFMVLRGKMDQVKETDHKYESHHNAIMDLTRFVRHLLSGFVSPHLPSYINCVRLVDWHQALSRRRHLLWSSFELFDPCHDVFVLHSESFKDSVSMEEIFDYGPTDTVCVRLTILSV